MKILTRVVGALATLTGCSGPPPVTLTVTDLGGSDSATPSGRALGVSEGGRIVGVSGPGTQAAEFHADGTVTRLPAPPGYGRCSAVAVTDDGVIAGTCTHDDPSAPLPRAEAVYWDATRVVHRFLESDPAVSNEVSDMNANGVILGATSTGDLFTTKAWTYDVRSGQLTQLSGLPNAALVVNSINDLGEIVGASFSAASPADSRPFKLSGTPPAITMLASPLGCTARANAINNRGVIVGSAACGLVSKPVTWSSATAPPQDLPLPPLPFGNVFYDMNLQDVSDSGVIVAQVGYGSLPIGNDVVLSAEGIAWTPERAIVELGQFFPSAVNDSGLIVGTRGARPATAKWSPYMITSPTNGRTLTIRDVSIVFSAVSGAPSEPGTTCQLDSAPPSPCTSPHTYTGLSDGLHTVKVTPGNSSDVSESAIVRFAVVTGAGAQVKQVSTAARAFGLENHTCAVLVDGRVRCWGSAGRGQLGYGNTNPVRSDEFPTSAGDVNVGGPVVQIAAGSAHTCALLSTGNVRCWGSGADGRLGYGNTSPIGDDELPSSAGDVNVGGPVVQITAGHRHTCALLSTGSARCWGRGVEGQLGYGNMNDIGDNELPSSAGNVNVGGAIVQIVAGSFHTCALLSTRSIRCWGDSTSRQLGYFPSERIGDNELPWTAGDVPLTP